ncbi:hypothetical protein [Azospirillum sp.]|uniref:hypothetical protein n=1 Tax=Azospirillum sp. TaxID=34012 RepID=UPI002D62BBB7|nr:hypothetical protein [Azospirillum sp.]HYD66959.1 hypothetical protein [Azospirillum sp.]
MLTYEDCIGLADLEKDEVAEIAEHERLPYMTALEKGAALLMQPWGDAAIRQMVWDNLCKANQRQKGDRSLELADLYRTTCERHPNPCDRRNSPVRPTHPIWRQ